MADKREDQLTTASDMAYVRALDSNGNSIRISKADLASVVAGLIENKFLHSYKKYENVQKKDIPNMLINKGVYLLVCYMYDDPTSAYAVGIYVANGGGEYNPNGENLVIKNMDFNLGWWNTINISNNPEGNITVISYQLI